MEVAVAGAAVGATIKAVLENLLSYPVEEIRRLWNFDKDFIKLKQSIVMILNFLKDAEMKHVTDESVIRWLQKLEDLAFDADYVFDELNYQRLRDKVESDFKEKKPQVSFSIPRSTNIPLLFRHKMAPQIKDIKKKLKSINKEARDLGLQTRLAGAQARGVRLQGMAYLETDSLTVVPVFVGRDNDVTKMVKKLTSRSTEHVIYVLPIVGMGGLGKTALTRKVFNHADIVSNFGKRMWVHVSENFDPESVLRKVVALSTGDIVEGNREFVMKKLQKSLKDKRYLLVLDNVWNFQDGLWDNFITSLEGICSVKGNVIIVTTRSGDVASIVKTLDIHELGVLSEKDCWLIIKANAFRGEDTSQFEAIGAKIARGCGGLPLAAKAIGGLLCGKPKDEWVSIEENLLSKFAKDKNHVSKILNLSYDNLPLPSYKKCFAFYSIIPRRWWSEKDELIQFWAAEGFLQTDKETDVETVGNTVFNHLVQSSMIEVCEKDIYGDVKSCIMHDLMHDLAFSILNAKSLDDTYQARYISTSHIEDLSSMPKDKAKCLRALFFEGEASKIMFSNFKHLHLLFLVDKDIDKLPEEIGNLISLRYLDISHTRIESLPDSICHLYHLQTLRAIIEYGRKAYLKKLPDRFKCLISLRHLYIPNIKLPPHIGKLTSLQTLPYFQVGDEEGCGIMELGGLKNLKGEIEIHNLEKVGGKEEAMSADLLQKPKVLKLKLVWKVDREGETNDVEVLEGLQPHLNLKILEINGYKGTSFPLWTSRMMLDNLMEIKLSDCKECEEIPMLGHLPHLKSLYLKNLSNVKYLGSSFYGFEENWVHHKEKVIVFPVLEKLELIGMEKLSAWEEVELPRSSDSEPCKLSVFDRLGYLKISNCRKLMSAPSQFQCLKELEVDNMESGLPLGNICGGSKLRSLEKLRVYRVDGLVRLPDALFSNNRALLELDIRECNNLTHLVSYMCLGGGGASLRKISEFWNFLGLLPIVLFFNFMHLVCYMCLGASLRKICDCLILLGLPLALFFSFQWLVPYMCLGGGGASLRKMKIYHCPNFVGLPDDLHRLNALEELEIFDCLNLKVLPSPSGGQLSSQGFTSLRILRIQACGVINFPIKMIESCASSLETLYIGRLWFLKNLPQVMSILTKMPRLRNLAIDRVPKSSDVAAEIGCLRRLEYLGIGGAPDCLDYVSFTASLDRILPTLQCLRELTIVGKEQWDALPEQLQYLTTLHVLRLIDFGIVELPEWLGNLESLKYLRLYRCPKLRRLASKKALTNLTCLEIYGCPLLKQNLDEEARGDDIDSEWSKISHIPTILVDGTLISAPAQ